VGVAVGLCAVGRGLDIVGVAVGSSVSIIVVDGATPSEFDGIVSDESSHQTGGRYIAEANDVIRTSGKVPLRITSDADMMFIETNDTKS
jgi:hypothetical protein